MFEQCVGCREMLLVTCSIQRSAQLKAVTKYARNLLVKFIRIHWHSLSNQYVTKLLLSVA